MYQPTIPTWSAGCPTAGRAGGTAGSGAVGTAHGAAGEGRMRGVDEGGEPLRWEAVRREGGGPASLPLASQVRLRLVQARTWGMSHVGSPWSAASGLSTDGDESHGEVR
jgi:hypothetical protein